MLLLVIVDVIADVLVFALAALALVPEDAMDVVVAVVHALADAEAVADVEAAADAEAVAAAVDVAAVGTDAMVVNLLTQAAVADIANAQIIQVSDKYGSRRIC